MTKSRFPKDVAEELLVRSGRRCCLCEEYKGGKVEVHHIVPKAEGGTDTADNGIVLCFDCHAEVHAYWSKNPKGRKFTPSELRKRRDQWFEKFQMRGQAIIDHDRLAEALAPVVRQALTTHAVTDSDAFEEGMRLQKEHRHEEAIREFYKAFAEAADDLCLGSIHLYLGLSHFQVGRPIQAEGHFTEARRLFGPPEGVSGDQSPGRS